MNSTEQYWGETFEIATEPQPDGSWVASAVRSGHPAISAQGATEREAADGIRSRIAQAVDRARAGSGKP